MAEPPRPGMTDKQARDWATFLHLSGLSTLISIPGIIGPLILWIIKKDESAFVDRHGKAAVNFHIILLIYIAAAFVIILLVAIVTLGIGILLLIPAIVVGVLAVVILSIVFPIIACLKAQNGEEYTYPLAIRFLK